MIASAIVPPLSTPSSNNIPESVIASPKPHLGRPSMLFFRGPVACPSHHRSRGDIRDTSDASVVDVTFGHTASFFLPQDVDKINAVHNRNLYIGAPRLETRKRVAIVQHVTSLRDTKLKPSSFPAMPARRHCFQSVSTSDFLQ